MIERRKKTSRLWPAWLERRADISSDWHDKVTKARRKASANLTDAALETRLPDALLDTLRVDGTET